MISLFLDTSGHYLRLAIYRDLDQLYEFIEESNNDLSVQLFPKLQEALQQTNLTLTQINKLFVVNGPGSFTGVRIGVTAMKTLAWGFNIPIVSVSSLQLLATSNHEDYIVSMIDARRGYVYAGLYDQMLNSILPDQYIEKEKLVAKVSQITGEKVCFVSEDEVSDFVSKPTIQIKKIIEKHLHDAPENPHTLIPNYLKRTEAEEKLEGKIDA